jgi:hypothetical protein
MDEQETQTNGKTKPPPSLLFLRGLGQLPRLPRLLLEMLLVVVGDHLVHVDIVPGGDIVRRAVGKDSGCEVTWLALHSHRQWHGSAEQSRAGQLLVVSP